MNPQQDIVQNFITNVTKNYAQFAGRASRAEFWFFVLARLIILLVFGVIAAIGAGLGALFHSDTVTSVGLGIALVLLAIYSIAMIVPELAIAVRRLHDTGKSGWWYLIVFVPYVGGLVLLIFLVLDSQPGPNQWGPHPYGLGNNMMPPSPYNQPPPGSSGVWPPPPQG